MQSIEVIGLASGKIIKTFIINDKLWDNLQDISLMEFLHTKNVPVASSCHGEGICQKCVVNNDLLSCQISLKKFLKQSANQKIYISYL